MQEQEKREPLHSVSVKPDELINQPKQQQQQQKVHCYSNTCEPSISIQPVILHGKPNNTSNAHALWVHQRQPLTTVNCSYQRGQYTGLQSSNFYSSKSPTRESFHEEQHVNYHTARSPIRGHPQIFFSNSNHLKIPEQWHTFKENRGCSSMRSPLRRFGHDDVREKSNMNLNLPQQSRVYHRQSLNAATNPTVQQQGNEQKQKCRYYVQGRCYFGDRCKYLHELAGNK